MKSEVYKEKVNTRDELVARIMTSAALIKQEPQDDFRRATRTITKRVEKCIEVNTYFELLQFIEIIYKTNKCNQYVICLSFISFVRLYMRNIKKSCIPTPNENWTHVYTNLFTRNSPYYHLLKYSLFLLKHPVYKRNIKYDVNLPPIKFSHHKFDYKRENITRKIILSAESKNPECTLYAKHYAVSCEK
jgi:hypothetical protein